MQSADPNNNGLSKRGVEFISALNTLTESVSKTGNIIEEVQSSSGGHSDDLGRAIETSMLIQERASTGASHRCVVRSLQGELRAGVDL